MINYFIPFYIYTQPPNCQTGDWQQRWSTSRRRYCYWWRWKKLKIWIWLKKMLASLKVYAIEAIHNHFTIWGKQDGPGVIDLMKSGILLYQDDVEDAFIIESYFSDFKENSLMHIALWHSLFNGLNGRTVANVIHEMTPDYWKNAFCSVQCIWPSRVHGSFALAHTTHKTLPVPINGMELIESFAKQIQLQTRRIDNVIPTNLKSFLSTIKVPYLIPTDHENQLLQNYAKSCLWGMQKNKQNSEVCFTIQNHPVKGVIECIEKKISRSVALSYIMKAIESP